jgi:hypothetical protein
MAQVAVLPTMHFPNGHIFFTARLPQREGITPYAVHCTYQYSGTPGKRSRFRCVLSRWWLGQPRDSLPRV